MGNTIGPAWSYLEHGATADRPTATVDSLGKLYRDTTTGILYVCLPSASTYAWAQVNESTADLVAAGGFRQTIAFGMANVAAGDNATVASSTPVAAQWAGAAAVTVGWVAPRAGSLTGLSAALSAAAAGSNLIVGVYKNGTILHASAIVTLASATSDTKAYGTFTKDAYTFAAGDVIDVRVRTGSGWSATTADLGVAVEVEC